MGRKQRRRRADRERATERDQADDEDERAVESTSRTPLGMPDAPIPDSPMPDSPIPDAGVPDMGMGGASFPESSGGQSSMELRSATGQNSDSRPRGAEMGHIGPQSQVTALQRTPKTDRFSKSTALETTATIRSSLADVAEDRTTSRSRNVSFAEVSVTGAAYSLVAVSGNNSPIYSVLTPDDSERQFETVPSGAMPRKYDSEVKLLERIAATHQTHDEGTVHIFTELPPCRSCARVIEQFEERFPNIEVIVTHGD